MVPTEREDTSTSLRAMRAKGGELSMSVDTVPLASYLHLQQTHEMLPTRQWYTRTIRRVASSILSDVPYVPISSFDSDSATSIRPGTARMKNAKSAIISSALQHHRILTLLCGRL